VYIVPIGIAAFVLRINCQPYGPGKGDIIPPILEVTPVNIEGLSICGKAKLVVTSEVTKYDPRAYELDKELKEYEEDCMFVVTDALIEFLDKLEDMPYEADDADPVIPVSIFNDPVTIILFLIANPSRIINSFAIISKIRLIVDQYTPMS
jgi:hypothetical protein